MGCSCRGLGLGFQHPGASSQQPVTPILRHLMPLLTSVSSCMHMVHIQTHKINIFKERQEIFENREGLEIPITKGSLGLWGPQNVIGHQVEVMTSYGTSRLKTVTVLTCVVPRKASACCPLLFSLRLFSASEADCGQFVLLCLCHCVLLCLCHCVLCLCHFALLWLCRCVAWHQPLPQ